MEALGASGSSPTQRPTTDGGRSGDARRVPGSRERSTCKLEADEGLPKLLLQTPSVRSLHAMLAEPEELTRNSNCGKSCGGPGSDDTCCRR